MSENGVPTSRNTVSISLMPKKCSKASRIRMKMTVSDAEQRFVTLGLLRGNVVSIVHTEEGDHIHVISMRKATKRERDIYFQSIAN